MNNNNNYYYYYRCCFHWLSLSELYGLYPNLCGVLLTLFDCYFPRGRLVSLGLMPLCGNF